MTDRFQAALDFLLWLRTALTLGRLAWGWTFQDGPGDSQRDGDV